MARGKLQHPVAKLPAGFVDSAQRERPDDAVDRDATILLERAHCPVDGFVEYVAGSNVNKTELGEMRPDLRHGGPGIAEAEKLRHVRLTGTAEGQRAERPWASHR